MLLISLLAHLRFFAEEFSMAHNQTHNIPFWRSNAHGSARPSSKVGQYFAQRAVLRLR